MTKKIKSKFYVRPFGFVEKEHGHLLSKKDQAIKINDNFFTSVELIEKVDTITKSKLLNIREFLRQIDENKEISDIANPLFVEPKNILNNKKIFKKTRKHLIFSILNITPDSFSDGGENLILKNNFLTALKMKADGADIIDIGGESTRPGAKKISPTNELLRILPTIQLLDQKKVNLSLDTRNSSTMEIGIMSGVKIINDVSALTNDKDSVNIIKKYQIPLILMHMPGNPKTMMKKNNYKNVVLDVYDYLESRINFCLKSGISKENLIIDPGIGFGKNLEQNVKLLKNLSIFHTLGCPIMLGISRKRYISSISKVCEPKDRLGGTISSTIQALFQGIQIHRVHDVHETKQAIDIFEKMNSK